VERRGCSLPMAPLACLDHAVGAIGIPGKAAPLTMRDVRLNMQQPAIRCKPFVIMIFPMPRRAEWWPNRLQEKQTSQHWPIASLVRPRRGKRQLAGVTRPVRPAPGSVATGITRLGVGSNASRPCRVRLGARAPPGLPPVRRPRAEVAVAAQPSPRRADRASAPIATSSMLITMASSRWRPRSRNWLRSSDPNCAIEDAGRRPVSRRHEYRIA
jgi:hypothetical protein